MYTTFREFGLFSSSDDVYHYANRFILCVYYTMNVKMAHRGKIMLVSFLDFSSVLLSLA
jgi:hypothetical protein